MGRLSPRRGMLAGLAAGASLALAPAALATFPGDNGAIAFSRDGDIWAINADGSGERRITSGPHVDGAPDWSPDGSEIAFARLSASGEESHIYVAKADGTGLRWVRKGGSPAWSGDGRRIAYFEDGLRVMDRDGSDPALVLPAVFDEIGANGGPLEWAPGTDLIGYGRTYDAFQDVAATSPARSAVTFAIHHGRAPGAGEVDSEGLSWAPDGTRLALRVQPSIVHVCGPDAQSACAEDPTIGLTTMTLGGTDRRTIVPEGRSPSWSPDGARIAYVTGAFPNAAGLWVAGIDGSGKRRLTAGDEPDWQSLPRPRIPHDPPAPPEPKTVTVTVPVEVPGPVRVVEKVVTRVVQGKPERCVIPAGRRKLTLTIRTTKAIREGAAVKITIDLARGKAKVARGKPYRVRVH